MSLKSIVLKEARYVGYMLCDSTYMNFWKKQKYRNRNQMSGCQGLEVETEIDSKGMWGNLGIIKLFYTTIMIFFFTQLYAFDKSLNGTLKISTFYSK